MNIQTILTVGLGAVLLAGCPATTTNSNILNNANKTNAVNDSVANKNMNAAANQSPVNEKPVEKVNLAGNWQSEFFNKKGEAYTELTVSIKQTGETVSGTYSVTDFIGDEAQVEDGNQTPFTGTVAGGVATIKFDTDATVPGYEENVQYKEPASGKPSTATLTMNGGKMQWKLTGGASPMEIPKDVVLNKAK